MSTIVIVILINLGIVFPTNENPTYNSGTGENPSTEQVDAPIVEVDVDGG